MTSMSSRLVKVGIVGAAIAVSLGYALPDAGASGEPLKEWAASVQATDNAFRSSYTSLQAALKAGDIAKARSSYEKMSTLAVNFSTDAGAVWANTSLYNAVVNFGYDMNQWAWAGYIAVGGGAGTMATYDAAQSRFATAMGVFTKALNKVDASI